MLQTKSIFALSLLLAGLLGSVAFAQTYSDSGFTTEVVTSLPAYTPVGLTWAPDGRMFIWQKNGIVRIYKNGALLATPFLDISAKVNLVGDRGLLGLALDPNFAANGYVYLFYTYEPNGNPNDSSPKTGRVTRVTASPSTSDVALAGSEVILLGKSSVAPCAAGTDCIGNEGDGHCVDTLRFGKDGKLYASIGDSASYTSVDSKALRAQDLNYYNGKVLRLNSDGTAPPDNPFYDSSNPNSVKSHVYVYGLRNPYRFGIHPSTGEIMIGDVGWYVYEELNRGQAGANYGWPCYEGNYAQTDYQNAFQQCRNLSASAVTKPFFVYSHTDTQAFGGAVIGGAYYTAMQYPSQYRGNFFFGEYVGQYINRVVFDFSNNLLSVARFASNVGAIVSLEQGPDGALYYIELITGNVRRMRYTGAASIPIAVASATPSTGASPLTVNFSSAGSYDPAGSALTYLWDFGDGASSMAANPQHVYNSSTAKTFTAKLTVTNSSSNSASTTLAIAIGLQAPVATITAPRDGLKAKVGSTVTYTGTAYDPDGTITASNLVWQVILHHNTHIHTYGTVTGYSGSFTVETPDTVNDTFYYEIILTVTDSSGLTDVKRVFVDVSKARR